MGERIELPTSKYKSISIVHIPQFTFGKRITIQAHDITTQKRGRDILDGHECDQVDAKGDIKFFSRQLEIL